MRAMYVGVFLISVALAGCATEDMGQWDAAMARYETRLAAARPADTTQPTTRLSASNPQSPWALLPSNPQSAFAKAMADRSTVRNPQWHVVDVDEIRLFAMVEADKGEDPKPPRRKRPTAPGWGKGKPGQLEYVPWEDRIGKAYPGHFWPSLGRWSQEMTETLWDDAKSTVTNTYSLIGLAAAGVAGAAIASSDLDDRVEDHYTKHGSQLGEDLDSLGGFLGSPALHMPGAFVYVLVATSTEDEQLYENSTTLLNALIVNGVVTQGLKWSFGGESPNGDEMGWPSGHSSSSFCLATVMYHQHGPWVGVPLLGFATFVAYQRVDARNHDFSDVVSGSLIGIAIGHAVASNEELRVLGMDVVPYADPYTGAVGVALVKQW